MERRGSGIKKIMDAYAKDKKKLKFEILGKNTFCVTFYSRLYKEKNDTANDTLMVRIIQLKSYSKKLKKDFSTEFIT